MKVFIVKIVLCIQFVMVWGVHDAKALEDDEAAAYLWRLINEARAKPLKVLEAYEIDYNKACQALGEDCWILETKIPPLARNNTLNHTSATHTDDMIATPYYDYSTREGITVHDSIKEAGYDPLISGRALGLVYPLDLYVDPIEAVEDIFKNMIKNEFNPDTHYGINIFNKDMTEIGISFRSTVFSWDPSKTIAYVATADFARPVELRSYIVGHVFNSTLQDTLLLGGGDEKMSVGDSASMLLGETEWRPEKADTNFILFVQHLSEGWVSEVRPDGIFASYQIEIPAHSIYALYPTIPNRALDFNGFTVLTGITVDMGEGANQLIDFDISSYSSK